MMIILSTHRYDPSIQSTRSGGLDSLRPRKPFQRLKAFHLTGGLSTSRGPLHATYRISYHEIPRLLFQASAVAMWRVCFSDLMPSWLVYQSMTNKNRMKGLLPTGKMKDGKVLMHMRRHLNRIRLRATYPSTGVAICIWARGYICTRIENSNSAGSGGNGVGMEVWGVCRE